MCSINSENFFRPWNSQKILSKSSIEDTMTEPHHIKCEFEDENESTSSSSTSNDSPTSGSLHMLSNFVMNSALSQTFNSYQNNPDNCESANLVERLKVDSSPCDSCPSTRASPQSAFTTPSILSSSYTDYLSTPYDPSILMHFSPHQLYYNLASMPMAHYKNVEEAVKLIHQQDIAAKQIKKLRPKKFRCEHCNVAFSNNGQLKGHIRIHTGERPFKCDAESCGKSFTRNEELTRHKRIHTGVRPHSCMICGKRFGRKDHLKKHTRTHDNRHGHFHLTTSITPFSIHGHPASILSVPSPSAHAIPPYVYSLPPDHISF